MSQFSAVLRSSHEGRSKTSPHGVNSFWRHAVLIVGGAGLGGGGLSCARWPFFVGGVFGVGRHGPVGCAIPFKAAAKKLGHCFDFAFDHRISRPGWFCSIDLAPQHNYMAAQLHDGPTVIQAFLGLERQAALGLKDGRKSTDMLGSRRFHFQISARQPERPDRMPRNILLVGAGRMGLRHLSGMTGVRGAIHVVDLNPAAADAVHTAAAKLSAPVHVHLSLESAFAAADFDAAILAATAAGRLETIVAVLDRGVRHLLLEKPVEQSRARFRAALDAAQRRGAIVHCNLYRRSLTAFHHFRNRGPLTINVSSGAMGLGCNGVHWIDFARFLAGDAQGRLLFGEIESTPIASGRGRQFRDYGGRGAFAFDDGSRLFLSVRADSAAPTAFSIVSPRDHWIVDQDRDVAMIYERRADSAKPNYLYGQDCDLRSLEGVEKTDFPALTQAWLAEIDGGPACPLPLLETAAPTHELLFDLLETGDDLHFPIT